MSGAGERTVVSLTLPAQALQDWRGLRRAIVGEISTLAHAHAARSVPVFVVCNVMQAMAPKPHEPELIKLCDWLAEYGIAYRITSGWIAAHTLEVTLEVREAL